MKAELVNPFIESVYELFNTMLGAKVERTGMRISDGQKQPAEVMALIGFSGVVQGTVGLALPTETCSAMIDRLLGNAADYSPDTLSDTIGELVNIVAGSAKAKISLKVHETLDLSLPIVFTGSDYEVYSPSNATWLEVPFTSALGDLTLRLTFPE